MDDQAEIDYEELYLQVKRFLFEQYEPSDKRQDGITMSTQDIFLKLQSHMPGNYYSVQDISAWMVEGGYKTISSGPLNLEWILKKRK